MFAIVSPEVLQAGAVKGLTSTKTVGLSFRDGEPRTSTSTFTQLLSSEI